MLLRQQPHAGRELSSLAEELSVFAQADQPPDDNAILATMAKLFDRPAFYTPIPEESNLPDFKQAITDTIQALNTGIWKARDGHLVDRIASRHQLRDAALSEQIRAMEMSLAKLRAKFARLPEIRSYPPLCLPTTELSDIHDPVRSGARLGSPSQ
jgi:hypothetical protein